MKEQAEILAPENFLETTKSAEKRNAHTPAFKILCT